MVGSAVKVTRVSHSGQELRRMALGMKDAAQARRVQAVSLVVDGWSRGKAAEFVCVDRQTLRDWVIQYNECGVDGLVTRTSPGRPRLLTPRQAEELCQVVTKGPDLEKDGVSRWRCEDLVKQSSALFEVRDVHPSTMAKWLHRMRLTKMTARPAHPEKDEEAQKTFKADFKEIVSKALPSDVKERRVPIEFWFQDEARVGQQGALSRVWAPIGSRPVMVRDNRRENAYIYGAICPSRSVGVAIVMPLVNTEAMNEHLKAISAKVEPEAHAVLLCDGAGWHERSVELAIPTNMTLVTLPPYSPELNPMENVWEFLRDNRFGGQVWKSYNAVVSACCEAWNWFVADTLRIASIGTREWVVL
jgi:transposase